MKFILRHQFGVFVATLTLGMSGALAFAVWQKRAEDRRQSPPIAFEQLPVKGFDEVTSAKTGDPVTVDGFIDSKGLCIRSDGRLCEVSFGRGVGDHWEWIRVRLRICDEQIRIKCITRMNVPVDFRDVWVQDRYGNQIDFDGVQLIEEPNTWTSKEQMLRISGRVTTVNGVGRFLEAVEIVGLSPVNPR